MQGQTQLEENEYKLHLDYWVVVLFSLLCLKSVLQKQTKSSHSNFGRLVFTDE